MSIPRSTRTNWDWSGPASAASALSRSMLERIERDLGAEGGQGWGMTETSPICAVGQAAAQARRPSGRGAARGQAQAGSWRVAAWSSRSSTSPATGCPGTARPSARSSSAVRGSPAATSRARAATSSTRRASSRPATSRPSTPTAICTWSTAPRTSSSPAASGSAPSTWRTRRWVIPAIAEAAVIGVPHPKWQERPLLIAVLRPGRDATREEILEYLSGAGRQVVAARRRGVRRRAAAHRDRQGTQAQAARAVPGC